MLWERLPLFAVETGRSSPLLRTIVVMVIFVLLTGITSHPSQSHEGATGIVKERMTAMSEMACAMKLIGQMTKELAPLEPEQVGVLARSIASRAAAIPDQFPDTADSRGGHKTDARLSVWARWKDFVSRAQRLEDEAEQLASLARAADATSIAAQFKRTDKTCSLCHKKFRAKKNRTGPSMDRDCSLTTFEGR